MIELLKKNVNEITEIVIKEKPNDFQVQENSYEHSSTCQCIIAPPCHCDCICVCHSCDYGPHG